MPEQEAAETTQKHERQARSLALEKAYVHDVYDQIAPHFTDTRYRAWPRIKQFLLDLEPGSLVADVGCGNGKYLDVNPNVFQIGSDRCAPLINAARERQHEVMTCDNLQLPYRDEAFDAALSIAVIHHFATTERRVQAIKELTRIVRIGGRVMITVWAMEQRHRKFESQDVLVPWHQPVRSSSEDRGSSVERDVTSTTTSDDDILIYQAYRLHTSDSDSHAAGSDKSRRRVKLRDTRRGKSFDSSPYPPRRRGSHATSPSETCYSFVRRALQKLSASSSAPYSRSSRAYFYSRCRKPWFHDSSESNGPTTPPSEQSDKDLQHQDSFGSEGPDDMPIELRHLEGYSPEEQRKSQILCEEEENGESFLKKLKTELSSEKGGQKSRSLGDILSIIPNFLRGRRLTEKEIIPSLQKRISTASDPREYVIKSEAIKNGFVRSNSAAACVARSEDSEQEETKVISNPIDNAICTESAETEPTLDDNKNDKEISKVTSLTSSDIANGNTLPDGQTEKIPKPIIAKRVVDTNPPNGLTKYLVKEVLSRKYSTGAWEESLKLTNNRTYSRILTESRAKPSDLILDKVNESKYDMIDTSLQKESRVTDQKIPSRTKTTLDCLSKINNKNAFLAQMNNSSQDSADEDCDSSKEGTVLTSYYSMPELHTFCEGIAPQGGICSMIRQRVTKDHPVNFLSEETKVIKESNAEEPEKHMLEKEKVAEETDSASEDTFTSNNNVDIPAEAKSRLVKRSMSVDNSGNNEVPIVRPRRFSASAAQGLQQLGLGFKLGLSKSLSKGSSLKSDTSVDSEESIISVIQRKTGQSMQSDTSVDSEESFASVIQRSASEIEALAQNREGNFRFLSRSTQASPLTITSTAGTSADCSPAQSVKTPNWSTTSEPTWKHELTIKYVDAKKSETTDIIAALFVKKETKMIADNTAQQSAEVQETPPPRKDTLFLPISDCDEEEEEDSNNDVEESKAEKEETKEPSIEKRPSPEGAADSPDVSPKQIPSSTAPGQMRKDDPDLPMNHKKSTCRISDWLTNQPLDDAETQNCTFSSICSTLEGSEPMFPNESCDDVASEQGMEFRNKELRRNSGDVSAKYSLLRGSGAGVQWRPAALRRHSLATCTLTPNNTNRLAHPPVNQKRDNQIYAPKIWSTIKSSTSSMDSETDGDVEIKNSINALGSVESKSAKDSAASPTKEIQQGQAPAKKTEDMILSEIARDLFECSRNKLLEKSSIQPNKSALAQNSRKSFLEDSFLDRFNIFSRQNSRKSSITSSKTEDNDTGDFSISSSLNDRHNRRNRILSKNSFSVESSWSSHTTSTQSKTSSFSEEDSEDYMTPYRFQSDRYIESYSDKAGPKTGSIGSNRASLSDISEARAPIATKSTAKEDRRCSKENVRPGILKDTSLSGSESTDSQKQTVTKSNSVSGPYVESILHNKDSSPKKRLVQQKSVEIVEKPTFIDGQKTTSITNSGSLDLKQTGSVILDGHIWGSSKSAQNTGDVAMGFNTSSSDCVVQFNEMKDKAYPPFSRNTSLSLSTSQESLDGNECGGGSLTYHRYYHVFREGELDHLIDKYVDNLHIISSFYDHANWCIIAEKVQVWTI